MPRFGIYRTKLYSSLVITHKTFRVLTREQIWLNVLHYNCAYPIFAWRESLSDGNQNYYDYCVEGSKLRFFLQVFTFLSLRWKERMLIRELKQSFLRKYVFNEHLLPKVLEDIVIEYALIFNHTLYKTNKTIS